MINTILVSSEQPEDNNIRLTIVAPRPESARRPCLSRPKRHRQHQHFVPFLFSCGTCPLRVTADIAQWVPAACIPRLHSPASQLAFRLPDTELWQFVHTAAAYRAADERRCWATSHCLRATGIKSNCLRLAGLGPANRAQRSRHCVCLWSHRHHLHTHNISLQPPACLPHACSQMHNE